MKSTYLRLIYRDKSQKTYSFDDVKRISLGMEKYKDIDNSRFEQINLNIVEILFQTPSDQDKKYKSLGIDTSTMTKEEAEVFYAELSMYWSGDMENDEDNLFILEQLDDSLVWRVSSFKKELARSLQNTLKAL
jgi:hypothetical protein